MTVAGGGIVSAAVLVTRASTHLSQIITRDSSTYTYPSMGRSSSIKLYASSLFILSLTGSQRFISLQRPPNLAVHLTLPAANGAQKAEAYVGWSGMASASSLAHFNSAQADKDKGFETIEIDPQYAMDLGLVPGALVRVAVL